MKKLNATAKYAAGVLAAGVFGLIAGVALGQDPANRFVGAFYSHDTLSRYEMPVHVDGAGKDRAPIKIEEQRERFAVPEYYGALITITQNADRSIFWYQSTDGIIRNVVLDKADFVLMEIKANNVEKLRVEVVR